MHFSAWRIQHKVCNACTPDLHTAKLPVGQQQIIVYSLHTSGRLDDVCTRERYMGESQTRHLSTGRSASH